jgi:hypothetical protein
MMGRCRQRHKDEINAGVDCGVVWLAYCCVYIGGFYIHGVLGWSCVSAI